jgi:hypothetical protein
MAMSSNKFVTIVVWATVALVAYEAFRAVYAAGGYAGLASANLNSTPTTQQQSLANQVAAGIPALGIVPISSLEGGLDFLNQDAQSQLPGVAQSFADIFG